MSSLFSDSMHYDRFARVVPERGIESQVGLTYAIPPELTSLRIGERVIVPLGKSDRLTAGLVVEFLDRDQIDEALLDRGIKVIERSAGALPGAATVQITQPLLELASWLAGYYCSPMGMVLKTMIPSAVKRGVGGRTRRLIGLGPDADSASVDVDLLKLPRGQRAVLEAALRSPDLPCPPAQLQGRAGVRTVGPVNRLIEKSLLAEHVDVGVHAHWGGQVLKQPDQTVTLNREQAQVVGAIAKVLGQFCVHLIHGVTGSGKTEVYLRLVEQLLTLDRDALVLVPEIALTPQTAGRFLARFPGNAEANPVAVLHSGLTAAQRHQEWARVAEGGVRVVVGARSAVFAPFPEGRLGLIVVDEEHDGSFKQDQLPRYQARDVAIRRGQIEDATIVLGSATPSLESYANTRNGRYQLHELPHRATGASMPRVEIVDFIDANRQRPRDKRVHLLTPPLETALLRVLEDGGQVILLLNRRGFANYICCPDQRCGWVLTCDDCDTTMVYHRRRMPDPPAGSRATMRDSGLVRCHHCLAERRLPETCPQCGRRVTAFGFGTQRVEEEINYLLPEFRIGEEILRLDSDTMRRAADYHHALEKIRIGEARLLVGTQMIAKGLDFPNVRLVGIINADTALNLPDFRACERTFQLVSQVAGRSGRADHPGLVIVQTLQAQAAPILYAARHDYHGFAESELESRQQAGLPPSTRMARIVIRDADHLKCYEAAQRLALGLGNLGEASDRVRRRGPMPCPISRIAGMHRQAIELTADTAADLQRLLTAARNARLMKADARTAVDVDPVALL